MYHELNSILFKFKEPIVDKNSNFAPDFRTYNSIIQPSTVAYLAQYLYEHNKTSPEVSTFTVNNEGDYITEPNLCLVLNTIAPIKMKEFVYISG